jgi:hypothetical protein
MNKMKFVAVVLLSQCFFGSVLASKADSAVAVAAGAGAGAEAKAEEKKMRPDRALVALIAQIKFDVPDELVKGALAAIDADTIGKLGPLGQVLILAKEKLAKRGSASLAELWDDSRRVWVENAVEKSGKYAEVFFVLGGDVQDRSKKYGLIRNALSKYGVVDVVLMTHDGTDEDIGRVSEITGVRGKLGIVSNEACFSGNGGDYLVDRLGAIASHGHGERGFNSSSPLYTFTFLEQWLGGADFVTAVALAQGTGDAIVSTDEGFGLASLLAGSSSRSDALRGSRMQTKYKAGITPSTVTVDNLTIVTGATAGAGATAEIPDAWACELCTLVNPGSHSFCAACETPKAK